jgi:hypothetical protein
VSGFVVCASSLLSLKASVSSSSISSPTSAMLKNVSRCARINGVRGTATPPSRMTAKKAPHALSENEPSMATTLPAVTP